MASIEWFLPTATTLIGVTISAPCKHLQSAVAVADGRWREQDVSASGVRIRLNGQSVELRHGPIVIGGSMISL
jgi:hypothetical protein